MVTAGSTSQRGSVDVTVTSDATVDGGTIGSNGDGGEPTETCVVDGSDCSNNNLQGSFHAFATDVQALACSDEVARLTNSTCQLAATAAGVALHISLLPITVPANAALSATATVCRTVSGITSSALRVVLPTDDDVDDDDDDNSDGTLKLIEFASSVAPLVVGAAVTVADEVGSSVMNVVLPMLGWQSYESGECTSEGAATSHQCSSSRREMRTLTCEKTSEASDSDSEGEVLHPPSGRQGRGTSGPLHRGSSFVRICDLAINMPQQTSISFLEIRHDGDASAPLGDLTASTMDAMVAKGLALAAYEGTVQQALEKGLPTWNPEGSTAKLMKRANDGRHEQFVSFLEKEVLLWHGKIDKGVEYGKNVPLHKGRGIVNMSPRDFTELFLDSGRTHTYNKYSLGRTDEVVLQRGLESSSVELGRGEIKVVTSENKIPFAGKTVVLRNLMHARKLGGCDESYIIVSRSVSRDRRRDDGGGSNVVWGVNVLRAVDGYPSKTDLTCVSQVSQSMVPGFLHHQMGLRGMVEVFNCTRAMCK